MASAQDVTWQELSQRPVRAPAPLGGGSYGEAETGEMLFIGHEHRSEREKLCVKNEQF